MGHWGGWRIFREREREMSARDKASGDEYPLSPKLPLPDGFSEEELYRLLGSLKISGSTLPRDIGCTLKSEEVAKDITSYCREHLRRFIYTQGLTRGLEGRCLELGSFPYFTTMLLEQFSDLELEAGNYFGPDRKVISHKATYMDHRLGRETSAEFKSHSFNIEEESFPFPDDHFDVVLFCEILEHLTADPVAALKEIRRVLKPGGRLILTTPNVNKLECVARMIAGANIYYPYTGYGQYGRHNREYNVWEVCQLMRSCGFVMETIFTADTGPNSAGSLVDLSKLSPMLVGREHTLGQYIFARAMALEHSEIKKPSFLYTGFPESEMEKGPETAAATATAERDIVPAKKMALSCGWHDLEDWGGRPTRWMEDNAIIYLISDVERKAVLSMEAMSFYRPMVLEIYAGDICTPPRVKFHSKNPDVEKSQTVTPSENTQIKADVRLNLGPNIIRLYIPDGGSRPCDIPELKNIDCRRLGIALQNIDIS